MRTLGPGPGRPLAAEPTLGTGAHGRYPGFSSRPEPLASLCSLLLPQTLASLCLSVTYFVFESSLRSTSEADPEMKIQAPVVIWKVTPGNIRKWVRM